MRIAILHNAVAANAPLEDLDTLKQVEEVALALGRLGHETLRVPCTLDLAAMREALRQTSPERVFNLVESLADSDALGYLPSAVLDAMNVPYTGNRTETLFLTTHKILAKQQMRQAGLPTPDWVTISSHNRRRGVSPRSYITSESGETPLLRSWIIKGVWDQGSRDLDDDAVLKNTSPAALEEQLARRAARTGRPCFAEQFIEGREFVVAMLAGDEGPTTLPPAETEFADFPPDKPRIVNYRAKWRDDCFEYHQTPRRFDFGPVDQPLLDQLRTLAQQCWRLFELRGWARVDFRVDESGGPWILEVNANPCLSSDAGFAAALQQADISFDEAIHRIVIDS